MYEDYKNQQDAYKNIELFPVPQRQPNYDYYRPLRPQSRKKKKQQNKNVKPRYILPKRNTKNQFTENINKIHSQGRKTHTTASQMVDTFTKLSMLVGVLAFGIIGLKSYLNKLNIKDLQENAYGGGEVSPSGRSSGHISEKGLALIKSYEKFHPKAYLVPGEKYYTIGYGDHGPHVHEGDTITEKEAEARLMKKIRTCEQDVNNRIKVPLSQNMFDALVSLAYNMGSLAPATTLVNKLNAGDYAGAAEAFKLYNKGTEGGKTVEYAGLTKRRGRESDLFKSDIDTTTNKLKTTAKEINPLLDRTVKEVDMGSITKAKQFDNKGIHYDQNSNITSHTKLTTGTNDKYNTKGGSSGLGTFGGYSITSGIGKRNVKGGSNFHRGLDLAFAWGTPIKAFCSGTVTYCSVMSGFGRCVIINDKNGFRHVYGHLSAYKVFSGQKIKKGQVIANSGASGTGADGKTLIEYCYAAHLHYGIWRKGGTSDKNDYIDPRTYIYPPEDGEIPQIQSQNDKVNKGNKPIQPSTKKPSTQNPTTKLPQPKQTTQKPNHISNVNIKAQQKKPNNKGGYVDIGKPDEIKTRVEREDKRYKK